MRISKHVRELGPRLVKALVAYVLGTTVAWTYRAPILARLWKPFETFCQNTGIQDRLPLDSLPPHALDATYSTIALVGGLYLAAPIFFYQLWACLAPVRTKKEQGTAAAFVVVSTVLLFGGALIGFRALSAVFFGGVIDFVPSLPVDAPFPLAVLASEYVHFVGQTQLCLNLFVEMPVLILFLSIAGRVNYHQLIRFGRWFVVLAFVVAAVITPPDTTSQIVVAVPLCLLYALSIGLSFVFGPRPSKLWPPVDFGS